MRSVSGLACFIRAASRGRGARRGLYKCYIKYTTFACFFGLFASAIRRVALFELTANVDWEDGQLALLLDPVLNEPLHRL